MAERMNLTDDQLENVVGGFMLFNNQTMTLTYTHADGSVTTHQILNYDKAWELSNYMHGQNYREDTILKQLKKKGYVS